MQLIGAKAMYIKEVEYNLLNAKCNMQHDKLEQVKCHKTHAKCKYKYNGLDKNAIGRELSPKSQRTCFSTVLALDQLVVL